MRDALIPDWLAEVVRPRPARPPWPDMIRAALAICLPLSVAFAVGQAKLGVLPAMGGLLGTMVDVGGSYLNRVRRVSYAALFGGAVGLAVGSVIHGHGWIAVTALVVVAGVSGVLGTLGDIGSATGMQLLVYTVLGTGPLGAQRPVWHTVVGFLVGWPGRSSRSCPGGWCRRTARNAAMSPPYTWHWPRSCARSAATNSSAGGGR